MTKRKRGEVPDYVSHIAPPADPVAEARLKSHAQRGSSEPRPSRFFLDILVELDAWIVECRPGDVEKVIDKLTRWSLPRQSMSDGRGGGSRAEPGSDKLDQWLRKVHRDHRRGYADLLNAIRRLERIQRSVLATVSEESPEPPAPERFPCANVACVPTAEHPEWGFLEIGRQSGECDRCRKHRSRTGEPWTAKPEKVTS